MNAYEFFAVSEYLSYFPEGKTYEEIMQLLQDGSDQVLTWEPFENKSGEEVADIIDALRFSLEQHFIPREEQA